MITKNCAKLLKKASTGSDFVGSTAADAATLGGITTALLAGNPALAAASAPIGVSFAIGGMGLHNNALLNAAKGKNKEQMLKELRELNDNKIASFIPLVSDWREGKRFGLLQGLLENKKAKKQELTTGQAIGGGALGVLGAVNPLNWIATWPAKAIAHLTPRKKLKDVLAEYKQQHDFVSEMTKAALIPGYAGYTTTKLTQVSDDILNGNYTAEDLKEADPELKNLLLKALKEKRKAKKA